MKTFLFGCNANSWKMANGTGPLLERPMLRLAEQTLS